MSTNSWILVVYLYILPTTAYAIGYPRYECGEHGRFEYCIDEIPGCIIGCHCHPGYYFDTESKICEANAKLVQEYRRLFEPTRLPIIPVSAGLAETDPTPTTITNINIDVEPKNTDDLGDWLYNQFFKTIENQVINKTDNGQVLTRRSAGGKPKKKPRKKSSYKKNIFGKSKSKKDDLRRKLLRITEDDSLFNSDSGSDDDSDSSSSHSESTSSENESKGDRDDNKEKRHRKIIMVNKKPRPTLPSFIFLPNIETPFYPPIGLPPPVMPMYPLVPVPPMIPFYPGTTTNQPGCTTEKKHETTKEEAETTESIKTTISPTTVKDETKVKDKKPKKEDGGHSKKHNKNHPDNNDKLPDDGKENEDNNPESENKAHDDTQETVNTENKEDTDKKDTENKKLLKNRNIKRGLRKKMLKRLRAQMKHPQKMEINMEPKKNSNGHFLDRDTSALYPDPYDFYPQDYQLINDVKSNPMAEIPVEDVDFKYLAQLIHRTDLNNTKDPIQPGCNDPNTYQRRLEGYNYNQIYNDPRTQNRPSRRFDGSRFLARPKDPNESYYTNLGRQIASLIRKIDTASDRQNKQVNNSPENPTMSMYDRNGPRSYWERSVRSPLYNLNDAAKTKQKLRNYENLFNLENRVEIIASTVRPLSLQQLENVIFLMSKAKSSLHDKVKLIKNTDPSHNNLKINLLPQHHKELSHRKYVIPSENACKTAREELKQDHSTLVPPSTTEIPYKPNSFATDMRQDFMGNYLSGILLNDLKDVVTKLHHTEFNKNESTLEKKPNVTRIISLNPKLNNRVLSHQPILSARRSYKNKQAFHQKEMFGLNTEPILKQTNIQYALKMPHTLTTFKNKNFYHDNKNHYTFGTDSIPFSVPYSAKPQPSYFHHEFHHFDFIE